MDTELSQLAERVGRALKGQGRMLAVAESCTGGWIAKVITDIPGCSHWFDRGFVTYTNAAKQDMLGVDTRTLETFGAVSEATVRAMAEGALQRSQAQISVAVSGIAGPGGGLPDKPVGTVWFGWAGDGFDTRADRRRFDGDREAVRCQSVVFALEGVLERLGE